MASKPQKHKGPRGKPKHGTGSYDKVKHKRSLQRSPGRPL